MANGPGAGDALALCAGAGALFPHFIFALKRRWRKMGMNILWMMVFGLSMRCEIEKTVVEEARRSQRSCRWLQNQTGWVARTPRKNKWGLIWCRKGQGSERAGFRFVTFHISTGAGIFDFEQHQIQIEWWNSKAFLLPLIIRWNLGAHKL